jgi:5-methylcytosine-specific restriction endonuclease McrA
LNAAERKIDQAKQELINELRRPLAPRYISMQLKRAVWIRDQGHCSYENCKSQHFLEIDHIRPVALGGKNELSNLRLVCRTHNQRAPIEVFGLNPIGRFLN